MDPKHTAEVLKHLEKQNEHLMDSYRVMSHELHKLQVEEEMLMRKFYELMSSERQREANGNSGNISDVSKIKNAGVCLVTTDSGQ